VATPHHPHGRRWLVRRLALLPVVGAAGRMVPVARAQGSVRIIDAQAHIMPNLRHSETGRSARAWRGSVERPDVVAPDALRAMDRLNVQATVLAPPPFPPQGEGAYGLTELQGLTRHYPDRFAFAAGGESLNPMLQETPSDQVGPNETRRFIQVAEEIAQQGAAGFGELAVEHFGFGGRPYESSPPDHPLLFALTDVAVRYGMPVALHMEAVLQDMPFPAERSNNGSHPTVLRANIPAFERLLGHNPMARIVWLHAGWDLTGERTVSLMRQLLGRHPNLFMTVKSDQHGTRMTSPFLPGFALKPGWLAMLRAFPDRFAVGSDQFFDQVDQDPTRIERARKLVDALPPDLAQSVGRENVRRIYRLPAL
jgi:predicted TIM-barrel fold metal-dependent hydrolase